MSDLTRITEIVKELRQGFDRLAAELATLESAGAGSGGAGDRSATLFGDRAAEVLSPRSPDPSNVILPSIQDQPDAIVGGELTADYPDCCAVGGPGGYFCTGTLIAPNLVVTAGHCTGVTRVFLKGSDVARPDEGETIEVSDDLRVPGADLRFLVLRENSGVQPRHVAQGAEVGNPATARLVGFGNINPEGDMGYGKKRRVDVPITSLSCATQQERQEYGCRLGVEIVAGHRGLLKDSCHGDSGGPLYIKSDDGGYYLLGATSRGLTGSEHPCGDGGIYVRVDKYLDWIRERTEIEIEGPLT